MRLLISACLMGENCKYNGGNNLSEAVAALARDHEVRTVCPEMLGGLPVPRVPAEIVTTGDETCDGRDGTVINRDGVSVDREFRAGAEKALEIAREFKPDYVVLQSRSPSCGVNERYDGTFTGRLIPGRGIFAKMAMEAGFNVIDAEQIGMIKLT